MSKKEIGENLKRFIILSCISLLLMFLDSKGWLVFFRNSSDKLLVPIEKSVFELGKALYKPIEMIKFYRSGAQRISNLERQVAELAVDASRTKLLEEENESMRKLLGAPLPKQWKFIPATLLSLSDIASIDVGASSGVNKGDAVVWEKNLIGAVSDVLQNTSNLMMLTNSSSKISVYDPRTGANGMVVGRFGEQLILTQVIQEEELKEDDIVVTSGLYGLPRGLVVGKVARLISDENDVYKEAEVEQLVDFKNIKTVFIVKQDIVE